MTYSEFVSFAFVKGVALRAVREQRRRDPDNLWVQAMERRIKEVESVAALDKLLADPSEWDWLAEFVIARSAVLASGLTEGDVYND